MPSQTFGGGPTLDPPVASGSALTATTIEALWLGSQFSPIFANDPKAGRIYCVRAGGLISTAASASTMRISPFLGAISTITLGASGDQTVPASLSNQPWYLQFDLVYRTIGAAGTNSTCIGTGLFQSAGTVGTAGTALQVAFGGTSASVDATINNSITIGKTLNVAGSVTTQFAYIFTRN